MNIFDADSDDGLSSTGVVGLILVLGFGAYFLWQFAYKSGATDVIRLDAPGCVVTSPTGQVLKAEELRQRKHVVLPKGSTLTSACLSPV